ncbi:hypothetical protein JGI9_00812, partial [Candidatus Kryptonium thompsonii]
DKLMPKAKIIYIAPFYAFSERIEMEGDKVIKCGDKLFKISELKKPDKRIHQLIGLK